jgi:hypothetical protein
MYFHLEPSMKLKIKLSLSLAKLSAMAENLQKSGSSRNVKLLKSEDGLKCLPLGGEGGLPRSPARGKTDEVES